LEKDDFLEPVTLEATVNERDIKIPVSSMMKQLKLVKIQKPHVGKKSTINNVDPELLEKLALRSYKITKINDSLCSIINEGLQGPAASDDCDVKYEIVVVLNTPLSFIATLYEEWQKLNTNPFKEFKDIYHPGCNVRWIIPYFNQLRTITHDSNVRFNYQKAQFQKKGGSMNCSYCDADNIPKYNQFMNYAVYGLHKLNPNTFDDHKTTFFSILSSFSSQNNEIDASWHPFYMAIEYCIPFIVFNPTKSQDVGNFINGVKDLIHDKTIIDARDTLLAKQSTSSQFPNGLRTGVIDLFESDRPEFRAKFERIIQHINRPQTDQGTKHAPQN
jgi:hypothetical protein